LITGRCLPVAEAEAGLEAVAAVDHGAAPDPEDQGLGQDLGLEDLTTTGEGVITLDLRCHLDAATRVTEINPSRAVVLVSSDLASIPLRRS